VRDVPLRESGPAELLVDPAAAGVSHASPEIGIVRQRGERCRERRRRSFGDDRSGYAVGNRQRISRHVRSDHRLPAAHGVEHADVQTVSWCGHRRHRQDVGRVVVDTDAIGGHAADPAHAVFDSKAAAERLPRCQFVALSHEHRDDRSRLERLLRHRAQQDVKALFRYHSPDREHHDVVCRHAERAPQLVDTRPIGTEPFGVRAVHDHVELRRISSHSDDRVSQIGAVGRDEAGPPKRDTRH
jgi:hypothetical protein